MASRLLITGGSGFLGWNLCQLAKDRYEVWSTYDQHEVEIPGVEMIQCDLTNPAAVRSLFNSGKFSGVIHAAAAAKVDYCQTHTRRSWRINVETPGVIAGIAAESRLPMVFTSTDLVFNGRTPTTPHARIGRWLASLDRLDALAPRIVVPGHGEISELVGSNIGAISQTRNYLHWLESTLLRAAQRGLDMTEVMTLPLPPEVRGLAVIEPEFRRSVGHLYPAAEQDALAHPHQH